jgi:hypothetical protein
MAVNSKSDAWETGLLLLVFNNTNFANIGDATGLRGSTVAGSLYVSLHTADPTDAGTQTSSEMTVGAYNTYARQAVARASGAGGFTVTASSVSPTTNIDFPAMVSGTGATATHFGIGTALSGTGVLLYSGAISPTIVCGAGVTPRITNLSTITED